MASCRIVTRREPDQMEVLWQALDAGVLQTVATDHIGWTLEQKKVAPKSRRTDPRDGKPRDGAADADLAGHARKEPGAAHIGEEADAGLGHGEQGVLGDQPMGAVDRHPDAAAHDHTVDERHIGLGIGVNTVIEAIFVPVEGCSPLPRSGR